MGTLRHSSTAIFKPELQTTMKIITALLFRTCIAAAQNATDLWLRGYSVIPTPRTVRLAAGDVTFGNDWTVDEAKAGARHMAVRSLRRDVMEFHGISLGRGVSARTIRLAVAPRSVATG